MLDVIKPSKKSHKIAVPMAWGIEGLIMQRLVRSGWALVCALVVVMGAAFPVVAESRVELLQGVDLPGFDYAAARQAFKGVYIANNGYDRQMAIDAVRRAAPQHRQRGISQQL